MRNFKLVNRLPMLLTDQRNELPFGIECREQENA
jgi:hypothetical protein